MMKRSSLFSRRRSSVSHLMLYCCCAFLLLAGASIASAQQPKERKGTVATMASSSAEPKLTRATTRQEVRQLPFGSTITLLGAPAGSITIEGWSRSEIEVTADIELRADTEEELTRLALVNSFFIDEEPNHLRIITTGTHDKDFMRRVAREFPKKLFGLPWKIDYRLRVPALADLEINAGRGPFRLAGVEGSISFQAPESDALLAPAGGALRVTLLRGSVRLMIGARSWRGAGANVQLAAGDLTCELPPGFSGDVDAEILRSGRIINDDAELAPRERTAPTERLTRARAGAGGATFALVVGDGTIRIQKGTPGSERAPTQAVEPTRP